MKKVFFLYSLLFLNLATRALEIEIIQPHQVETVKQIIIQCAFELWQPQITLKDFAQELENTDEFEDFVDIQSSYSDNGGIFLVLLDNQNIVGSGAIRKFNDEVCELMRLWFFKEYRGRGLGLKMAGQLLEFAKAQGYKKIRLDVYQPEKQQAAVGLYRKFRVLRDSCI